MTHSKIQKMKFYVFLFILLSQKAICDGNVHNEENPVEPVAAKKSDVEKLNSTTKTNKTHQLQNVHDKIRSNGTAEKTDKTSTSKSDLPVDINDDHEGINLPALQRGFVVFLCLGLIVIIYIVFRTFRLNKTRPQMIKKYGVLTHRQDVEMRPLPLDEDDEDDTTIFDVRNIAVHGRTNQQPTTA